MTILAALGFRDGRGAQSVQLEPYQPQAACPVPVCRAQCGAADGQPTISASGYWPSTAFPNGVHRRLFPPHDPMQIVALEDIAEFAALAFADPSRFAGRPPADKRFLAAPGLGD